MEPVSCHLQLCFYSRQFRVHHFFLYWLHRLIPRSIAAASLASSVASSRTYQCPGHLAAVNAHVDHSILDPQNAQIHYCSCHAMSIFIVYDCFWKLCFTSSDLPQQCSFPLRSECHHSFLSQLHPCALTATIVSSAAPLLCLQTCRFQDQAINPSEFLIHFTQNSTLPET